MMGMSGSRPAGQRDGSTRPGGGGRRIHRRPRPADPTPWMRSCPTPLPPGSRAQAGWGPKVFTRENLEIADRLREFAESRGHSLLELAFAWLASHKVVASVIAGAKSPEQVRSNARAADWKLDDSDLAAIEGIAGRHSAQPVVR